MNWMKLAKTLFIPAGIVVLFLYALPMYVIVPVLEPIYGPVMGQFTGFVTSFIAAIAALLFWNWLKKKNYL
jgi:hypothetical protein